MKIGILGSVFVNVKISLDGEFDPLGANEGHAVTSYGGSCVELAKYLSDKNEVIFITSLDTEAFAGICRLLKKHNIDTRYCTYQYRGTGFKIEFRHDGEPAYITGSPCFSSTIDELKRNEAEIFENLDVLVSAYIDEDVFKMCGKYRVPLFILAEKEELESLDDSDIKLIRRAEVISKDNAIGVLTGWEKLPEEEKKMLYDHNDLIGRWENLVEEIDNSGVYEELKHLIYDTYHYFRNRLSDNDESVARKELLLYKYAGQIQYYFSGWCAEVEAAEAATYNDALSGLCYVVENGFDVGYYEKSLPLGLTRHTPAGGADPEADMTSYETFEKSLQENTEMLRAYFDEA